MEKTRTIANFGFSIRKKENKIEVVFKQAKRVPKSYGNFIASLEIACLNTIHKFMNKVDEDGKVDEVK